MIEWEAQHRRLADIVQNHIKFMELYRQDVIGKCDVLIGITHFKDSVESHMAGMQEEESYESD